ncbi:PEP-CTERM sorting domain-containing protein [Cognaticolwellia beringensis]|uniref:PEP-CTERM sorting domain-containing protein n=1 Tax=Cognaticolwellia beringensis TaxID=1967665 RepID=A0A222G639_9GAMM|nr:PEP-CTERM sorting domain-containing protein [Cognaticolwellia beringensis]ASP47063.1 hypothetical protein B5D82_04320 [Cognaticolwellia beringensis]
MKVLNSLLFALGLLVVTQAKAGFITTNENELDRIFSQTSFDDRPIDIRIGKATELILPTLLDISSDAEIFQLFNQLVGAFDVVNFYFIDTISACGIINVNIVGCGEFPGNDFVVESSFAAGSFGGELLAHELGHNLGLPHRSGQFLMNGSLNNNTTLTLAEVNTIHTSYLVKNNGQATDKEYWIDINPVLIVATPSAPVPEPSTLVLLLLPLGFLIRKTVKLTFENS